MWVLLLAGFMGTNEPGAVALDVFPTASACIAAKRDAVKLIAENIRAEVTAWGVDCVEVKLDGKVKAPEKAKS